MGGRPSFRFRPEIPARGADAKMIAQPPPPRPALGVHSKPQLLAWLTCDGVHIDPGSGKHTILGVFSNIHGHQFPLIHPFMIWFLSLTDCAPGEHTLKISIAFNDSPPQPLLGRPFQAHSPLDRLNLINEIRNLPFPAPGEYSLMIEIDDEPLLSTNIVVTTDSAPPSN